MALENSAATTLPASSLSPVSSLVRDHLLPLVFYFIAFALLTWPAMSSFSTSFFGTYDDLYQNLWNLWWVDKSLTELHRSPYYTTWLHYPHGTTLFGHTLNPFNGLVGIPLRRVMSPVAAHNALVVFAFVAGGWTMYHFARAISGGSRGGALLAGFIFTFCAYHFAHSTCHLPLTTLQWVPLCLLTLLRLFTRPTIARALLAAGATLLVAMSEHYYLLYCTIAGLLLYVIRARDERSARFGFRRPYVVPLLVFLLTTAATSGILIIMLLIQNARDPFFGGHSASVYSADLLAPFIPGGSWRFGEWTKGYWGQFYAGWVEASVYVGWGALLLAAIGWRARPRPMPAALRWCLAIVVVFLVLSLGPTLRVWDFDTKIPLPYKLIERIIPAFKVTGMPMRMVMMVSLGLAVLAACGWARLERLTPSSRRSAIMLAIVALILFETWPRPMLRSATDVPAWVHALKAMPGTGGIIDVTTPPAYSLYYQTIHEKPFSFGYISREPSTVATNRLRKRLALRQGDFAALRDEWRLEYLIVSAHAAPIPSLDRAYSDEVVTIYRL